MGFSRIILEETDVSSWVGAMWGSGISASPRKSPIFSPKQGCGVQSSMLYRNIIGVAALGLPKEGWRRLQWDVSDWHCVWFTFWVKELQPPCELVSCGTTLARIHFIICFLWAFWVLVFLFWLWIYLLIFKIKKKLFWGVHWILAVAHRIFIVMHELPICGTQTLLLCSMWDLSSPTRDQTQVPYIASWIPNHWTTREGPIYWFLKSPPL